MCYFFVIVESATDGKLFGTADRFPSKKAEKVKRAQPGPGKYDLISEWQGKPSKFRPKTAKNFDWQHRITKGTFESKSIYY